MPLAWGTCWRKREARGDETFGVNHEILEVQRKNDRVIVPAADSRTTVSASCATSSPLVIRRARKVADPNRPSFNVSLALVQKVPRWHHSGGEACEEHDGAEKDPGRPIEREVHPVRHHRTAGRANFVNSECS